MTPLTPETRAIVKRCHEDAIKLAWPEGWTLAKAVGAKANGKDATPQNFETALRQRMIDELRSHTDRGQNSHTYFWERLFQAATPDDLAELIQEAKAAADKKEAETEQQEAAEKEQETGHESRIAAVEDHLTGQGDGRFGEPPEEEQEPTDATSPETVGHAGKLLAHYRGRSLGVEARKPDSDEHAMTTPDPDKSGAARVTTYGPRGVRGHSHHETPGDAVMHMAAAGFTEPAPGSYAEHSESPDWDWHHQATHAASTANGLRAAGQQDAADDHESQFYGDNPHPAASQQRRGERQGADEPSHGAELDGAVEQEATDTVESRT